MAKKELPMLHSFIATYQRSVQTDGLNPPLWQEALFAADINAATQKAEFTVRSNLGDIQVKQVVPFLKDAGRIGEW